MLTDSGFTAARYPGIVLEGLQTMDEAAAEGKTRENSKWLKAAGTHVSVPNFDQEVFYWVDVEGPEDLPYLNQHVFYGSNSGGLISMSKAPGPGNSIPARECRLDNVCLRTRRESRKYSAEHLCGL